jgi:Zn-dependent protease/CBS domain-containing protein
MGWSLPIARLAGTEVKIHVTFLLLLIWIWIMHYQIGGSGAAWQGVTFVLAVFLCVLLHEFGHVLAARQFGIRTPDITLLPIGGLARLERMPDKPAQELVVAIAGPLVNVVIAAVLLAYSSSPVALLTLSEVENPETGFIARLAGVNVFLVLFNLIPAFPMDGGRVLRALLAFVMPWARATRIAATIGQGFAFLLGFVGLLYNPLLIFIAIFVYLSATAEAQDAQLRDVAAGIPARDAMVTNFVALPESATIADAVSTLLATMQHDFPVTDTSGRLRGLVIRDDIIQALKEKGLDASVLESMRMGIPIISDRSFVEEAFRLMRETGAPAVAVTDGFGRLAGLVTHETIGEMVMIRSACPHAFDFLRRWQRARGVAA